MKVISLLQPWATLVVIGAKKIETRSWNTKYRGEILIHASKKMTREQKELADSKPFLDAFEKNNIEELPLGKIIGKVKIIDTASTSFFASALNISDEKTFGNFSAGRYGWLLRDPVSFQHHFPVNGNRSLWDFNEKICLQCGCSEKDACIHPDFGPCWWVEEYLCSHCTEIA